MPYIQLLNSRKDVEAVTRQFQEEQVGVICKHSYHSVLTVPAQEKIGGLSQKLAVMREKDSENIQELRNVRAALEKEKVCETVMMDILFPFFN